MSNILLLHDNVLFLVGIFLFMKFSIWLALPVWRLIFFFFLSIRIKSFFLSIFCFNILKHTQPFDFVDRLYFLENFLSVIFQSL